MTKYNIMATRQDWEHLYKKAEELGFDVKPYKKSQNFDQAVYAFYVEVKYKFGVGLDKASKMYPIYSYENTIKTTIN